MGKYLQAKEVVKDSFWIVERNGTKIGTLREKQIRISFTKTTAVQKLC